jgi:guanine nucleotide-binding protein subunit alpha
MRPRANSTGAGESGKSTILKQMKLLYATGFSKTEKDDYRSIVFANILNSFKTILEAMEHYDLTFERRENEVCCAVLFEMLTSRTTYI